MNDRQLLLLLQNIITCCCGTEHLSDASLFIWRVLILCFYFPAVPLLLPWLSLRSVLVVAMVSASAMRDICSIRVKPGKLEWRRWLERTWACSGPKYVGLYWDRSITYRPGTRQRTVCKMNLVVLLIYKTRHNRERQEIMSNPQWNTQYCMRILTIQAFPNASTFWQHLKTKSQPRRHGKIFDALGYGHHGLWLSFKAAIYLKLTLTWNTKMSPNVAVYSHFYKFS